MFVRSSRRSVRLGGTWTSLTTSFSLNFNWDILAHEPASIWTILLWLYVGRWTLTLFQFVQTLTGILPGCLAFSSINFKQTSFLTFLQLEMHNISGKQQLCTNIPEHPDMIMIWCDPDSEQTTQSFSSSFIKTVSCVQRLKGLYLDNYLTLIAVHAFFKLILQ